jgi:hypothetical protein
MFVSCCNSFYNRLKKCRGRIMLKLLLRILGKSGQGPVAGYCEHNNEPSGSIKGGEFFD